MPDVQPDVQDEPTPRDHRLAEHVATKAFLLGEWAGALILCLSFAQLFVAVFGKLYPGWLALSIGAALVVLGGFMFLRNRRYYESMAPAGRRRSHNVALVFAGGGGIFWLLFLFLVGLTLLGVPILPEP